MILKTPQVLIGPSIPTPKKTGIDLSGLSSLFQTGKDLLGTVQSSIDKSTNTGVAVPTPSLVEKKSTTPWVAGLAILTIGLCIAYWKKLKRFCRM